MFQSSAFQTSAFQSSNDNSPTGGGKEHYVTPYQKYQEEEYQRELLRKEKSELDKLESVLRENERKKELAAQARLKAASEKRQAALARAEAEFLAEINRLLMVRAELMRRIREGEALLILMIVRRKRLLA